MSNLNIIQAMAEFQAYLRRNIGAPINLITIQQFGRMSSKIENALAQPEAGIEVEIEVEPTAEPAAEE